MSDKSGNGADQNAGDQPKPALNINGQYVKDLSFEAPNSPLILPELQNAQPNINITVNVSTAPLEGANVPPHMHEVVLDLQAAMKVDDKTGFIVELKYGGIFTVNVPEEHLTPVLLIECPRLLFPFARQILADTTQNGGFMPLLLQPLDFAGMYQARAQQEANSISAEVDQMIADKQ